MSIEPDVTTTTDWLTYADAASQLGVDITVIRQLVNDGELISLRIDSVPKIAAQLIVNGEVSKYLRGIITSLRDGGFSDEEALRWLLAPDDSLGGSAALGLHKSLHREVSRRAQALAF
ncbi:MAG: Rv2175c family DNA-binding protein [Antricoccus sp.]